MSKIINFPKDESRIVRWLNDATHKDREGIHGIYHDGNRAITADGHQMRITPLPQSLADNTEDGTIAILDKSPRVSGGYIEVDDTETTPFPDWKRIVPTTEPSFEIDINGKLLASIVKDMGYVRLKFTTRNAPVLIQGREQAAVLMPLTFDGAIETDELFNPIEQDESTEESE